MAASTFETGHRRDVVEDRQRPRTRSAPDRAPCSITARSSSRSGPGKRPVGCDARSPAPAPLPLRLRSARTSPSSRPSSSHPAPVALPARTSIAATTRSAPIAATIAADHVPGSQTAAVPSTTRAAPDSTPLRRRRRCGYRLRSGRAPRSHRAAATCPDRRCRPGHRPDRRRARSGTLLAPRAAAAGPDRPRTR